MSYYAMVRGNVVVQVVRMDSAPDGTGYDLVEDTQGVKCEPGYTRSGVRQYAKPAPAPEVTNEASIRQDIANGFAKLRTYRALTTPTAAQRIAYEDDCCTLLLRMGRLLLGDLSGID